MSNIFKNNAILLLFIYFIGVTIRIWLILTRNVFTDEVYYLEVAIEKNISQILLIDHWIKNQAILHYFPLKLMYIFTQDIIYIRFINLAYYSLSFLFLYKIIRIQKLSAFSLLSLVFFSFHKYFIYVNTLLIPYSLTITLTIISIYFFIKLLNDSCTESAGLFKTVPFAFFSALAFYANYTSLFLAPFYYIATILMKGSGQKIKLVAQSLTFFMLFITPGIFQFLINLEASSHINRYYYPKEPIITTILHLAHILFFKFSKVLSTIFLVALLIAVLIIGWNKKFQSMYRAIALSIVISCTGLFFVNYNLTFVYLERSFWYLYLQFTVFLLYSYEFIARTKLRLLKNLLSVLTMLLIIGSHNQITASYLPIPGDVSGEYSYYSLFNLLDKTISNKVLVIDTNENYHPLQNYYGIKGKFTHPQLYSKNINSFQKKDVSYIYSYSDLEAFCASLKDGNKFIVVLFDWNVGKLKRFSGCILDNALSVYYLNGVGTDVVEFIKL